MTTEQAECDTGQSEALQAQPQGSEANEAQLAMNVLFTQICTNLDQINRKLDHLQKGLENVAKGCLHMCDGIEALLQAIRESLKQDKEL